MKDWRFCPERARAWRSEARIQIASAGRFSGKSETYVHKFQKFTMRVPHDGADVAKYSYCFPTLKQAKRNVWDKLKAGYLKTGAVGKINESELKIELVFKGFRSIIYIDGLDQPHRIEGSHYHGICIDEMSDTKPNAVKLSVIPALNAHQGWLWMLGVPKRIGVGAAFYKELCTGRLANDLFEGSTVRIDRFHWTAEDIYTAQELVVLKRLLSPKDYNEQALAKWETVSGLVYYSFKYEETVFTENRYDPNLPLLIGSDFNVSPMSWVICQENGNCVNVLDELSILNTNTIETLNILYQKYGSHHGGFVFYGDAAGRQRHTNASVSDYILIYNDRRFADPRTGRVDIRYSNSNPAIIDRLASVNAMLQNAAGERRLFVSAKCKELIKDFEDVAFREGTREIDKSDLSRTHMSDALGYLIHARHPMIPTREGLGTSKIITGTW